MEAGKAAEGCLLEVVEDWEVYEMEAASPFVGFGLILKKSLSS